MRRKSLWVAASLVLAVVGLLPVFSSGAAPVSGYKVIYSFAGGASDGEFPGSDLTFDAAGNLYGTTEAGGPGNCTDGCGTVFELKPSGQGWTEQVLYSFASYADGSYLTTGVILDASANLYGTAGGGGYSDGIVFKLSPNLQGGWTKSTIYSFNCQTGPCGPNTDLVFDAHGDLFGTTSVGGNSTCPNGCGAVFELIPQSNGSWKESTVYEFSGPPDGENPSTAESNQREQSALPVAIFARKDLHVL